MNIALVLQHKLMLGLQRLMGETAPARPASRISQPHCNAVTRQLPQSVSAPVHQAVVPPKPLRVLRVVDKDQPRSCSGRMVISGRMADVCAELDRLAAREAALH